MIIHNLKYIIYNLKFIILLLLLFIIFLFHDFFVNNFTMFFSYKFIHREFVKI